METTFSAGSLLKPLLATAAATALAFAVCAAAAPATNGATSSPMASYDAAVGTNFTFPDDARLVNVKTRYGAKGDGKTDDTEAIQKALNDHPARGAIIYLPNGTYVISKTLNWPAGNGGGGFMKDTILQGQSRAGAVIRLADNAPGFGDAAKARNMIYTGGPPAQRFRNAVHSLTIDSGNGNPGAIGLSFCANNQGAVINVAIRSGADGKAAGFVGLDMSVDEVGPQLIQNVSVLGFETGIRTGSAVNSITLENIELSGQRQVGYHNRSNLSFIRNLQSRNSVRALLNSNGGVCTLVDSVLIGEGAAAQGPAMVNESQESLLYARNVQTSGYAMAIKPHTGDNVPVGTVNEWVSGPVNSAFPGEVRSLNLPIKDTPMVPWDDPKTWASPMQFGGSPDDAEDDTVAIQKAIDSGATTVFLSRGERYKNPKNRDGGWLVSDTIHLRGKVRRIIGTEAVVLVRGGLVKGEDKPVFHMGAEGAPVVTVERISMGFDKYKAPIFLHDSRRTLVLRNFSGLDHLRVTGGGELFTDDVVGDGWIISNGSKLWARQLNMEGPSTKLINDGGQVWILGFKTECRGPLLETRNGGKTEIIGAHMYTCVNGSKREGFVVDNAQFSIAGGAEYVWTRSWITPLPIREVRGTETRTLNSDRLPRRGQGSLFPLISSIPAPVKGSAPLVPTVSMTGSTSTTIALRINSTDPEDDLTGFQVQRDGKPVGATRGPEFQQGNLKPATEYTYQVVAYDRSGNASAPTELKVQTSPDTTPPTAPGGFRTARVIDRWAQIAWNSSKDDVDVTHYELQRVDADGKVLLSKSLNNNGYTDEAVKPGAVYTYRIAAVDAAANRSQPSELKVAVPAGAPEDEIIELERPTEKHPAPTPQGFYLGNLASSDWATYKNVELGRTKPFNQMTLRYAIPAERAGAVIEFYLDAKPNKGNKEKPFEGLLLGTFTIEGTGGWDKFVEKTLPAAIPTPGIHTVTILVRQGEAKVGNALVNVDWLRFSFAK